jgi:alkylation response protein AidB-like acyl-CoA dehydrogenase
MNAMTDTTLDQFEQEVTSFLEARAPRLEETPAKLAPLTEEEQLREARRWQAERYDAGLGWITGPAQYGGRELGPDYERAYRRLERGYRVPATAMLNFGLTIIGSCIAAHGSPGGREKYLRALYRGELMACQLFSEPSAGSDLAAVQTRAVREGDGWVLNGQKVWTSSGHLADVGECVCRTDMDAPKHRGITIFMVDMHAPGVEVRPLPDLTGEVHFNEVFLSDVHIGDDDRLGEVNHGWHTLNTSLMNERSYVAESNEGGENVLTPQMLSATLQELERLDDPVLRDRLADLYVRFAVAEYVTKHARHRLERGETPGAEMSLSKLTFSENQERLVTFAADALGALVTADSGEDDAFSWARSLLRGRALRIAGGTDEIQRTIIGERVLGLPRDPAIDNSIPFKDIPRSVRRTR